MMIELSAQGWAYLEHQAFSGAFCSECPMAEWNEGTFDETTGFGEPPHGDCPVSFDPTDPNCYRADDLRRIVELLQQADEVVDNA